MDLLLLGGEFHGQTVMVQEEGEPKDHYPLQIHLHPSDKPPLPATWPPTVYEDTVVYTRRRIAIQGQTGPHSHAHVYAPLDMDDVALLKHIIDTLRK